MLGWQYCLGVENLGFKTQPGRVGVAVAMPEDSQPGMVGDKIKGSWDAEAGSCLFVCYYFYF